MSTGISQIGTRAIETERCILRRIEPEDYEEMYGNWGKYEEVCRYFPFAPAESVEQYRKMVQRWAENYQSGIYFHWVIEWKENGKLIGTINLGNVDETSLYSDTCYMLSPEYQGCGIMTEVLQSVLCYAFDEIGLNRVQAEVFAGNDTSARVLTKCGMQLEGIARKKYYKGGRFYDTAQYAAVRGEERPEERK